MEENYYDLVVLGGGPGGYTSALRAVTKGLKVSLIEEERLGGTCLNWGCFPTKSLLRDAKLFSDLRASEFLEGQMRLDFAKVMDRKERIVSKLVQGIETILLNRGVAIIEGKAKIIDSRHVAVIKQDNSEIQINTTRMILAPGARLETTPFVADHRQIMTSRDGLTLRALPRSLAIIGSGRRGVEFAMIFRGFGSEVVLLEKEDRIVPREDMEISHRLRRILTLQGIKVMTGAEAFEAKISEAGTIIVTYLTKKGEGKVDVEKLLVPGKRVGNTEDLGLEGLGIATKDGFIEVNENLETPVPGIYAVGDANGKGFLAHKALVEGLRSVDQFTGKSMNIDLHLIPRCTYTNPEIGSIGLTQMEAEKLGEEISIGKFPIGASGRAATLGQDQGIVKIVSGKKYGEILGVHILAPQATELISLASLAMRNELGVEELKAAVYGHPTVSEAIFEAALDVKGEAIHFLTGG